MAIQKILNLIEKQIESFEYEKIHNKNKNRDLGIIYTPNNVVDYIVSNIIKIYFQESLKTLNLYNIDFNLEEFVQILNKNRIIKEKLSKTIKNIKILDPSCGSGRFLISTAEKLYKFYQIVEPELNDFEIKKKIIRKNLYGIEIDNSALIISKLRLIKWLLSTDIINSHFQDYNLESLEDAKFDQIIKNLNLQFNLFNLDFLLEFDFDHFSIIIGNPPYVENKKIKDIEFKKKLRNRYNTAYRLFDLSILFIERSIELLDNDGLLSFILPNKFLSADYGIKIRSLLLEKSEIKEIVNISSLSLFQNVATYPIILSVKKNKKNKQNETIIKILNNANELAEKNAFNTIKFDQNLINRLPSKVIPISGNIELIQYLFRKFNTFANTFKDLKIIYRPFGFLKYRKYFDNISENPQSNSDLLLVGTGNIEKYYIKFNKRTKISGKDIKISFFNYNSNFKHIWSDLNSEKLIFREIAKDLTCCYDPGVFTNITGLYFIKIPSFSTDQLFGLLTILNSQFMDSIFKTLFSTLHMAGGYLRFNGSFIKRLPLPRKFPEFLSELGKILHFLSQLKYDFGSKRSEIVKSIDLIKFHTKYYYEINTSLDFFEKLANSLVMLLFLDDFYLKSNLDYYILRDLIDLKRGSLKIPFKFLIPVFDIRNYKIYSLKELDSILTEINKLYAHLYGNQDLLNQLNHIIKNRFS
ncbi:MAG: class I SAM-dependent DNA methyltransferase [Candidatus Odinarchaeota archaeon]